MGAPLMIASTVLRSRTARKIIAAGITLGLLITVALITPLVAIPLALAAHAAPAPPAGGGGGVVPAVSGEWGYPLAGEYTKGRGFGYHPVEGCSYCTTNHMGYDMAQGCGATIFAAGPGTIITAGPYGGYGNAVRIDHGNGLVTLYGHMQWGSIQVTTGQTVTAGVPLGSEGNTGKSVGCHLHFEVQVDGLPVPPEQFMSDLGLPLT